MKRTFYIIWMLLVVLAPARASEIRYPEHCVSLYANILRRERSPKTVGTIDYEKILKHDKKWTKKKIHALFRTIDPSKLKFREHEDNAKEITLVEPIKVRLIFEMRRSGLTFGPPETYWLVGIDATTNGKAEQDGADQPATAPESKSEGNEKAKPESEGRSQ